MWSPSSHKTAHHGKARVIAIGPKAQIVLQAWLSQVSGDDDFLFAPAVGDFIRRQHRSQLRKTPLNEGNRTKPLELHTRLFQNRYPVASYRRAIARACDENKITRWSPNQLRHAMATTIRREFGLEAAQVVLGHSRADVTQIYAEKNSALAAEVARKIG